MLPDDVYRSRLEATIASLRYWVPTVADAAKVTEATGDGYWKIAVRPLVAAACPFDLMLRADQRYDIVVAGESFEDQPIENLEQFVPMATAMAEGRVIQRWTFAAASDRPLTVETILTLPGDNSWRALRPIDAAPAPEGAETILKDRHFLPYRREIVSGCDWTRPSCAQAWAYA